MRKDAEARRRALLAAAGEMFVRAGFNAPLEDIAAKAGVGRGTLYRNFADRHAMAEALLEQEVDRLEAASKLAPPGPEAFFFLITELASGLRRTAILVEGMRRQRPEGPEDVARHRRVERLFAGPIRDAQVLGRLRGDLHPRDVLLLASMLCGGLTPIGASPDEDPLDRSLGLLIDGLRA